MCTLFVEKGTFVKETSNVDGTDQTITLSNGSLTPKVLWLWTTGKTSNATYAEDYMVSYGFSDGTNDACVAGAAEDNETSMDCGGIIRSDACCVILDAATTPTTTNAQADVVSFNAGNFVLNWAVSDATASIIHYMVAGGTDITNVFVLNTTTAVNVTGNRAYTGVGFQGDFLNIITAETAQAINVANANFNVAIGAAASSTARWSFGGSSESGVANADTYGAREINKAIISWSQAAGTMEMAADLVSFGSDGFTLNYSNAPDLATQRLAFLVIKGGLWNVGNGTAPASPGQQTITTTSGRDPEGVMFFTWGTTATTGITGDNRISIGGADNALNEGCVSLHDATGGGNAVNSVITLNNKLIRAHTANVTASSSTTLAEADIVDMNNDGNFIIDWTTTLSAMGYVWFALSQAFAAGNAVEKNITESAITISDLIDPSRNKIRTRSEIVTCTD